ncbi:MAG TPA: aromatic amino acid lyase [Mycobacteriales bacterium]|nr:aromatic amino acid lyase [Mycobacteriales bacterium]
MVRTVGAVPDEALPECDDRAELSLPSEIAARDYRRGIACGEEVSVIVLDGRSLTASHIAALAHRQDRAELPAAGRDRATASAEFAAQASRERPVYGRSTGVGANRDIRLADPAGQALSLLRSHATTAGPLRSPERVRAMLAIRLNQLASGGSGAAPAVLDGLAAMLERDALPPVRELGSIGTGDLSALAVTGLALIGEVPTRPRLDPIELGIGDVLPLMSSNAATLADAALAIVALRTLTAAALRIAALTFAAVNGNPEAFAPAVEAVTPFPGARRVCRTMRGLLTGTALPARIQDPFGLRALPQVHGALLDQIAAADSVVTAMVNAPSENPVLLPDLGVAHHGGFHAAYLAQTLDVARIALAQSAGLSLARVTMFNEPALTGVTPFLGDGTPGASGVMVVEYVAASALAALRELATPVSVQAVTLSRGAEEHASFASLAATAALQTVDSYRTLLGCELLSAMRCLRMRSLPLPAGLAGSAPLLDPLGRDLRERDLTPELDLATSAVDELA